MRFLEKNLPELIIRRAEQYGDKPFFYYRGKPYSYGYIDETSGRIAAALKRLGVHTGDHVVVGLPNSPETLLAYSGVSKSGAVYVPANIHFKDRELRYYLENSEATAIIGTEELIRKTLPFKAGLKHLKILVQLGGKAPDGVVGWEELIHEPDQYTAKVDSKDVLMISYTSGTTGNPKGAIIPQGGFINNASRFVQTYRLTDQDISINMLPYNHIFAPIIEWMPLLVAGGQFILRDGFLPRAVLEDISKYRATYVVGVPPMFMTMLDEIKRHGQNYFNLESLRFCIVAAAPMPLQIQKEFESIIHAPFLQIGGQTEGGPITVMEPLERPQGFHPGTCGTVLFPDVHIRLIDEDGCDVKRGEIGEMLTKSPDQMLGYWKMSEETAETIEDGWIHSGDMAYQDEDGYYYMVDRIKHMIITNGRNVFPAEIEKVLYLLPKIQDVAVIGMPDEKRGESVEAFIVVKEGETLALDEIKTHLNANLVDYKRPRRIHFVDELPKTVTGKIRKVVFREQRLKEMNEKESQAGA
ncbi:class I adenylate-forming enzyme family protein [Camelliibacillus cellulosilyticus]|uniref:Class I adenylate-forming enzyme family protein n=1 Tax=Camelliibacillus cellulosilyticus TaxID=2174486 RepID=A0ABV9GQ83_9BACL